MKKIIPMLPKFFVWIVLAVSTNNALANTNNALIPILLYFLEEPERFGSIIHGKLYSASELTLWRNRANNGPHLVRGDAYGTSTTGSIPYYRLIKSKAQSFSNTATSEITIEGISQTELINRGLTKVELNDITFTADDECAVLDPDNNNTKYDWYEFGRMDLARDAAFVDLISDASINTSRIKSILLSQAQKPCVNFSNREIFRNGEVNNNAFWLYMEWIHKALKAYDYLDSSAFTPAEKAIIDNWFKGAAEWSYYYLLTILEPLYITRDSNPINSVIDLSFWQNDVDRGFGPTQRHEGGSLFWPAGSRINNRQLGQLNFVTHAGVKYNNEAWKKEGAQTVKEYVSFHFDDNGYFAELNRSITNNPTLGLAYGANTMINVAEIANILYLDGYENLFKYKSKARINQYSGEIEEGTEEKSLEWVLLKFRKNFMLNNAPGIYPLSITTDQQNSDTVIHFCKNTQDSTKVVGRMYNPAAIINRHYKNPQIKEMYNASEDYGNLCNYKDSEIDISPGPHAISPGVLFQYSDADEDY